MKIYNCLIADDEPLARQVLQEYIALLPNLKLVGSCRNAGEAMALLHNTAVDIIFCDIKMPGVNGLQFIRSLQQAHKIIITTAYTEYAVEGFNIGVTDYLLKPISTERFLLAVNRAVTDVRPLQDDNEKENNEFTFFKTGVTTEKVFLNNIYYIEAAGNYSKLHLTGSGKTLIVNHKISDLETDLKPKNFVRLHKSYIANVQFVQKITAQTILVQEVTLPVGDSYKKEIAARFKNIK